MRRIALGTAAPAVALFLLVPAAHASFGLRPGADGFAAVARAEGGAPDPLAGSHPYALTVHVGLRLAPESPAEPGVPHSEGDLRDLRLAFPPGLIVDPAALSPGQGFQAQCTAAQFAAPRASPFEASASGESCPDATQAGTVELRSDLDGGSPRRFGLFNLTPPPGIAIRLGAAPYGVPLVFDLTLRPDAEGRYAVTLEATNFTQSLDVSTLDLALWGVPWAASHDGERGDCLHEAEPAFPWAKCSVGEPGARDPLALLGMPAACEGPLAFSLAATSWQGGEAAAQSSEPGLEGCSTLRFEPHPSGQLTDRKASSSSGFAFDLLVFDEGLTNPERRIASPPRRAVVVLPEGVTVNPSVGAGLGVCTPAQYAAETAGSPQGAGCPNASKIGDFTVTTPLFAGRLEGAIYLAKPHANPFDTLLAVYLVTKSAQRGILVKVAGRIDPDPVSGRLTATFDDLPQLPYGELEVHFRSGQRAPLVTPPGCGPAVTQIELAPWAAGAPTSRTTTASPIDSGIEGGACPGGSLPPFAPGVVAGGVNSNVGSYTPYFVHLIRKDTEQELTSYSLVLPRGITAKLAGIPFCPDGAIAAARGLSGEAELAHPPCPAASLIGHTLTGYGVGHALTYAPGEVYLAGPYHGQPLSVVTIDAATVGPFDLGTLVIRSAFEVDPVTAQLRIDSRASDPIPHILGGVPLRLRDVRVSMDRPEFTRNPTSCEPSQLVSTLTGAGARFDDPSDDPSATVSERFQLLNCTAIGFRPKLGLRLRGGSRRGEYPSLRAEFVARPGDANLKRIGVTMPHSEFLAQNHIRTVCTREQFAAEACPPGSVYGSAVAATPLFDEPLRGPVYLRSSPNRLPDLVASLRSGAVRIVLAGKIGPAKHGIRAFFGDLPDAPITTFVMTMQGGRRGLLVNSTDICARPPLATVKALGQNDLGAIFRSRLRGQCKGERRGKAAAGRGGRGR